MLLNLLSDVNRRNTSFSIIFRLFLIKALKFHFSERMHLFSVSSVFGTYRLLSSPGLLSFFSILTKRRTCLKCIPLTRTSGRQLFIPSEPSESAIHHTGYKATFAPFPTCPGGSSQPKIFNIINGKLHKSCKLSFCILS